jgi:hypothetical protein
MRKYLLAFVLILTCLSVNFAQTCKKNVIDCKGICGRFTDNNADQICDLSPRSPKVDSAKTSSVACHTDSIHKESLQQEQLSIPKKNNGLQTTAIKSSKIVSVRDKKESANRPVVVLGVRLKVSASAEDRFSGLKNDSSTNSLLLNNEIVSKSKKKPYALLEISGITLGLYLTSFLLVIFNIIKRITHRKIWNVLLLITFLMSGILGLFLVFQLNYKIAEDWYMKFLKIHVEFGITMVIISIIHLIWHWTYYLNMLQKKNNCNEIKNRTR